MSEGTKPGAQAHRSLIQVRNPQDFWGGFALIVFAIFALWAGSDLSGIRGFQFGPGTAPRMFAIMLPEVSTTKANDFPSAFTPKNVAPEGTGSPAWPSRSRP